MLSFVSKFLYSIKTFFSLLLHLPQYLTVFGSFLSGFFDFLPGDLPTYIGTFFVLLLTFIVIYALVRLVASLL